MKKACLTLVFLMILVSIFAACSSTVSTETTAQETSQVETSKTEDSAESSTDETSTAKQLAFRYPERYEAELGRWSSCQVVDSQIDRREEWGILSYQELKGDQYGYNDSKAWPESFGDCQLEGDATEEEYVTYLKEALSPYLGKDVLPEMLTVKVKTTVVSGREYQQYSSFVSASNAAEGASYTYDFDLAVSIVGFLSEYSISVTVIDGKVSYAQLCNLAPFARFMSITVDKEKLATVTDALQKEGQTKKSYSLAVSEKALYLVTTIQSERYYTQQAEEECIPDEHLTHEYYILLAEIME